MSLINDALKKAQRQRTEDNMSPAEVTAQSAAPEQLHRVARRGKPAGFRSQLMLVGGGAIAAVVLVGIGAMFFFRSGEQPAQVATTPTAPATVPTAPAAVPAPAAATAAVTVASPSVSSPAPTNTPAPAPVQSPTIATPVATAATPVQNPGQFALPPASATVSAPITATTPDAPVPTAVDRPKPSTRMIGVINHFRVGGIRVSGAESKVLMNDKVYRINDVVDYELNIRLTAIEPKALTFEDSRGAVYTRTF